MITVRKAVICGLGLALALMISGSRGDQIEPEEAVDAGHAVHARLDVEDERAAMEPVREQVDRPLWREVRGALGRSQTVAAALDDHGIGPVQVDEVVRAMTGHVDFRRVRAGSKFTIELRATDDQLDYFGFETGPLDVFEAVRDEAGVLRGHRVPLELDRRVEGVAVTIEGSLYQVLDEGGEMPELVSLVADVFAWDIDFYRDQHPGDRFRALVEKQYRDGELVGYGRILAAEYDGLVGTHRTFWFEDGTGQGDYYLEDGRSARKFFLATPLKYTRVSSSFSTSRRHPILGYNRAHLGVDYAAPRGTPVRAMAAGQVIFAGRAGGSGNLVKVRHRAGLESHYAHLHRIDRGVRRGARVDQKQVIGSVGSTGLATGPHLHFAVKKNGKHVNPQKLKLERMDPVPPGRRGVFDSMVAERKARLEQIGDAPAADAIAQLRPEP